MCSLLIAPMDLDCLGSMEIYAYAVAAALGLALLLIVFYLPKKNHNLPPSPPAWPLIGHFYLLSTLPHQSLARLSQKYGPLMFLKLASVPTVVVSNAALAREFLKTYDQIFASRPSMLAGKMLHFDQKDIVWAEYGPGWRDARKTCQLELFTPKRLEASKHIRLEETYFTMKQIRDKGEGGRKAVDVRSLIFGMTRNILTRMVLNKKYFGSESEEALEFEEFASEYARLNGAIHLGDFIPFMKWLDIQGHKRQMKAARKKMDSIMDRIIQEHLQKKLDVSTDASRDFIDVLITIGSNGDDDQLNTDNIKALAVDMLLAGSDTIAATIEWALSEILLNPLVQQKAQKELDDVVGQDRKVEEADLPQLKYLQAIVKETFRLHPALPFLVPHESTQAVQVYGYDVPSKSRLLVNVWAIGRDPARWERPLEFCPDRFVGSSVDVHGQDFELIPFGSGRRGCPGLSLGVTAVQLALAVLLQSLHWSLPPASSQKLDMSEGFGLSVHKALPLHAITTPRLSQHALYQ